MPTERVTGYMRRRARGKPLRYVRSYTRRAPVYYHLTSDWRLPLILEEGLKRNDEGVGRNYDYALYKADDPRDKVGYRLGKVYLARDMKSAEFFDTKARGYRKGFPVVLEVNARGLKVKHDPHHESHYRVYKESAVTRRISPRRLRVLPTPWTTAFERSIR